MDASSKKTREEVEAALAETKARAEAANAAARSALGLCQELRRQQEVLEVELRSLTFVPNATMTRDLLGPFSMSSEIVPKHLLKSERVQAERGDGALVVTRKDGQTFRVADELVAFDADGSGDSASGGPELVR